MLRKVKQNYNKAKNFSLYIVALNLLGKNLKRIMPGPGAKLLRKKHIPILKFLTAKYGDIISRHANRTEVTLKQGDTIWTTWWQGVENAPELVKRCIESIQKNAGVHPVVIITESNYRNYIELPEHIVSKTKQGIISLIHLADILKMKLLAEHGGVWLDATVFTFKPIPDYIFDMPLFSGRHYVNPKTYYQVSSRTGNDTAWAGNIIGGSAGHPLYEFAYEFLSKYTFDYSDYIDYFLLDYTICLAYENINAVKRDIDSIPINNEKCYELINIMNNEYDSAVAKALSDSNTLFYKLNWRRKCKEYTSSGHQTFYHKFIAGEL